MNEIELKFAIAPERLESLRKALHRGSVRTERLQAAYFDTADDRLARQHVALRLRREGDRWIQTAKAGSGDPLCRLEDNVDIAAPSDGGAPSLDVHRHDVTPAGHALAKALGRGAARRDGGALLLRFQTDVERARRTVRFGRSRIEIALDIGAVSAGELSAPVCELELELKSGDPADVIRLAAQWVAAHGLWISTLSKSERGTLLAGGGSAGTAVEAVPPRLGKKPSAHEFFAATFQSCLAQVLGNASRVAGEPGDDRSVHQLRVGLRRMRTALRELGGLAGSIDPAWEGQLRAAFNELGDDRDRSVVLPQVQADLAAAGAPSLIAPLAAQRARQPQTVVRSTVFQRTLLDLIAFGHALSQAPAGVASAAGGDPRALVAQRLDELLRLIVRDGKRFAKLETARQHRVRKRLKRLRYLGEFAAPLFGAKAVERYLQKWRRAQDALGEYNDQRVSADAFEASAATEPHAWFGVGWLAAHKEAAVERCQRALRDAAKARPFWKEPGP